MSIAVSHDDLAASARRLRDEASRHEVEGLRHELQSLLESYIDHTVLEEPVLRELPSFTARLVRRGQERVLQELMVLAVAVEGADDGCECARLVRDVVVRLESQIESEHRTFDRCLL